MTRYPDTSYRAGRVSGVPGPPRPSRERRLDLDLGIAVAGLGVGFIVGLTGMGGGALMTPILVLIFGVDPLTAVSSDLVASMVMKPVGGTVHLRRGTVNLELVRWLVLGSVPAAFAAVYLLESVADAEQVDEFIARAIGVALLLASVALVAKGAFRSRPGAAEISEIVVRPVPTVAIGVFGGVMVGLTSVGSGSLMMVLLLMLYPTLTSRQLVGTDLVQAIPLVGAAAVAHLLFGDVELGLTASLLVGALPGVYIGARVSSRAPDQVIRPILAAVLIVSGLKMLGAPTEAVAVIAALLAVTVVVVIVRAGRHRDLGGLDLAPTQTEPDAPD